MKIGAQLYNVRNFCKTPEDLSRTLQRVAEIGYRYVQASGICACDPSWLAAELQKYGLKCPLSHTGGSLILEKTDAVIAAHNILNCKYIGLGSFPLKDDNYTEKYDEFVSLYTPVTEKIATAGHYFMYHNHAAEFRKIDGELILAKMAEDFDPSHMGFTLDTYWVQVGGCNPAEWISLLAGRVPCIHLKDYAYGAKMAVVGEGNINFDAVFAAADSAGTEYMFVEQDDCYGEDPFDCLARSYAFLKSRGLE